MASVATSTRTIYERKSMQGLIDLTRKGFFPEGSRILSAHLGGAPAINGYSYYYRLRPRSARGALRSRRVGAGEAGQGGRFRRLVP